VREAGRNANAGENRMFIAMNRFKVLKDQQKAFEEMWFGRESRLN
jgi:heme-degrading monooxygenase HmoA